MQYLVNESLINSKTFSQLSQLFIQKKSMSLILDDNTLFELLFFLCPKSLSRFAQSCQQFSHLVNRFHKCRLSDFVLCQWHYTFEILSANYEMLDIDYKDFFQNTTFFPVVLDALKGKGLSIVWFPKNTDDGTSTFVLYSFLGKFFSIDCDYSDLNLSQIDCCFPLNGHFVEDYNAVLFHCSNLITVIFHVDDLAKIRVSVHKHTKLLETSDYCSFCLDCFPNTDINKLPNFQTFEPLPDNDIISIHSIPYQVRFKNSQKQFTLENETICCHHNAFFGDRFILVAEKKFNTLGHRIVFCPSDVLKVFDILTQTEYLVSVGEGVVESLETESYNFHFSQIYRIDSNHSLVINDGSKIDHAEHKFIFSNKYYQNWFVLTRIDANWKIHLIKKSNNIVFPVFDKLDQRFII